MTEFPSEARIARTTFVAKSRAILAVVVLCTHNFEAYDKACSLRLPEVNRITLSTKERSATWNVLTYFRNKIVVPGCIGGEFSYFNIQLDSLRIQSAH